MKLLSGRQRRPRRVLLYGQHGIGKTSWALGAPKPIFLDLEDGLGDVDVDRTPLLTDFGQFMEASSFLVSAEHGHKTVVVDTVDWLERLVHRDVARAHNKTSIEEIPYGKGYMLALDKWDLVLSSFEELRRRGLAVILLAHSRITKFNDPTTDSYDRYEPDLHKTVSGRLMEWCDEVLFATYAVRTVKVREKFNAERVRAIGSGERVVYTCEMPTHLAKRRCELPDELPLEFAAYVEHVRKAIANGEGDIAGVVVDGSSKKREVVNG